MTIVDDQVLRWSESIDQTLLWTDRWTDFKAAFIKRFGRTTHAAWRDLVSRKQTDKESVRAYGEAVRALAIECGKSCEEDSVVFHFQQNIKEPVRSMLKVQCSLGISWPYDQILEIAENIEKTVQESEVTFFFGSSGRTIDLEHIGPWATTCG